MVSSASVQVPLPLLVAARPVCPPTSMRMVAALSFTVPVNWGRVSAVVRVLTVMTGGVVSICNSPEVPSLPMLPKVSVAVTCTL